jgi:hypothetical protein
MHFEPLYAAAALQSRSRVIRMRRAKALRHGLAAIVCLAALGGLASLGYAWVGARSATHPERAVAVEVGGEALQLSQSYWRASGRDGAPAEIAAFFPDFKPAGGVGDITARTDVSERFQRLVFLTPRPADPVLDPSDRTERLYERFLAATSWSHPGGLTAREFEDGSPFEGDELFYVQPEGRGFAARCRRPDPSRKTPNTCISVFRAGGLDVEMRFAASLLGDWEALLAGARGLIEAARRPS